MLSTETLTSFIHWRKRLEIKLRSKNVFLSNVVFCTLIVRDKINLILSQLILWCFSLNMSWMWLSWKHCPSYSICYVLLDMRTCIQRYRPNVSDDLSVTFVKPADGHLRIYSLPCVAMQVRCAMAIMFDSSSIKMYIEHQDKFLTIW